MPSLHQIQVIVDPVGIHLRGQFIKVDGELGQMEAVVGQGTLALARNGNFLLKLGQQFSKSCYIRTGGLEEVWLFFFMINNRLRMNQKVTSFRLLIGETTAGLVQQCVNVSCW